jgi:hypothetical protein
MGKVVLIAGDTGTGKSRAMKNLNPKETYIVNVLNKPLPFKGSGSLYSSTIGNMYSTDNYVAILNAVKQVDGKMPGIKNLILDDIGFTMTTELFNRSAETGFVKFTEIGLHMQQIIKAAKDSRPDLNVALVFHTEDDTSDKLKVAKKLKTIGSLLDDKYNPLGVVAVCLITHVDLDAEAGPKYSFVTNRTKIDGIMIPAKSPEDMFESLHIDNDLKLVFESMEEYLK